MPAYRPKIQTDPVVKKRVKVWTPESVDALKGCFECTEWNVLLDSCESVNEATDVISGYISFCEDTIIPQKIVKIYPNNKPWISKSLKTTLNQKKLAFQCGNKSDRKSVQEKLRKEIRESKKLYREKVESHFQYGNMADAWKGLKILTGQNKTKKVNNTTTTRARKRSS